MVKRTDATVMKLMIVENGANGFHDARELSCFFMPVMIFLKTLVGLCNLMAMLRSSERSSGWALRNCVRFCVEMSRLERKSSESQARSLAMTVVWSWETEATKAPWHVRLQLGSR